MKLPLVLAILACLGTSSVPLVSAQSRVNLTIADSGVAQLAPRIEYRNGKSYVAYIQAKTSANGDIMFLTRGAGEMAFGAAIAVTNTGKINATLQRGPEFAVAPNGTIHMVWMEQRIGNNPDVFYSRGIKNGTEWSHPVDISQDGQIATQDFASIAVDSTGNVYVAWVDNREVSQGTSKNDHIYLTRSFDGGMTWDAPKRAEKNPGAIGGSCECCRTAIAASPDGDLYIVYRTNMENSRDIFVARSTDKGETFEESIRVQTKEWMINACPATGPMAALDARENLHMIYRSAGNANKAVVFYNQLPRGSDRTFTEIPLTDVGGSSANYGDIAVAPNGALSAVYQQSGMVYERLSTDGGNSWSLASEIDSMDAMQMFPVVGYDPWEGMLSSLWQDDRRDKNDIMMLERPYAPMTTKPMLLSLDRMMMGDSVRLSWTVPGAAPATWYEIAFGDTRITTFRRSLMLSPTSVGTSSVTVTPWTAIGSGEGRTLTSLSVGDSEHKQSLALSKHPVFVGDYVSIALQSDRELEWTIYDVQGRAVSTLTSIPYEEAQQMQIPQLPPGVYHLRCNAIANGVSFIVAAR